ncbi:hypothetical protein Clacol_004359 [Clathrus columnatus]|uniref:Uncharacterized protein n=1 Tax=Clathrus columnatus TaxID=1419009 RepID=A0AAV5AAC5_9AGAM|nr:hypothetical protein Clacol_004359 [Clathrus columnatus]
MVADLPYRFEVAANLEAVCNGGDWNIPQLPPGEDYAGPTDHQATECTCSTVTYSLVSACAVCQQRDFASRNAKKGKYNPEKMRFDMAASPAPLNPAFTALLVPPVHQELKLYVRLSAKLQSIALHLSLTTFCPGSD